MALDYSFVVIDILGLLTIVGIGYYASRILVQMKTGLLEKSWRYLVAAAYVLLGAVVVFMIQQFSSTGLIFEVTSHLSAVLLVIGGIYILLGFRAHYIVFSPKHPKVDMGNHIDK
ncbi:MAG: hypothetical protein JRN15_13275 [Nitrososphaerota archaeon]|nr:hypothetical protein [Nitrososphaerota archaeon]